MEVVVVLVALVALGVAADLFGVDTRPVEKPSQDR